jgi:hypothetical protein
MEILNQSFIDTSFWEEIFSQHRSIITQYDTPWITQMRLDALEKFSSVGITIKAMNVGKKTDITVSYSLRNGLFSLILPEKPVTVIDFFYVKFKI